MSSLFFCQFSLNIASDIGPIQTGSHLMEAFKLQVIVYVRTQSIY